MSRESRNRCSSPLTWVVASTTGGSSASAVSGVMGAISTGSIVVALGCLLTGISRLVPVASALVLIVELRCVRVHVGVLGLLVAAGVLCHVVV
jgi:hypothetical protein